MADKGQYRPTSAAPAGSRPGQGRRAGAEGPEKEKPEWLKPGLVGRVKFLNGEEKLRHAKLLYYRGG
ncbi:hypothetical protein [Mesorhizobium sp. B2-6-7]|uniref:hypothetical protein n=1 Tax=Mesorhizobium sp. B2-6-7 TaxID=2589910 RepID=UPI001FEDFE0E|nr:hypothetical protein [Mesorhizobium sp. B2-6-7]